MPRPPEVAQSEAFGSVRLGLQRPEPRPPTAVGGEKGGEGRGEATHLLHHVEREAQPLALQHGDQVSEQHGEVLVAVPEGNEDRHLQRGGVGGAR